MQLYIQHGDEVQEPVTVGELTLTQARAVTPAALTFTVVKNSGLDFQEGEPVRFSAGGTDMFYGYVFTKSRSRDGLIAVTCYDQTRYLKNKGTFVTDEGLTAAQVVRRLAADVNLQTGTIADTGYVIPVIDEENVTYFDMIQNALDETLAQTGELFILYDDMGSLTLRSCSDMGHTLLLDAETASDFRYETTIDTGVYTRISLYYEDAASGARARYVLEDAAGAAAWGVLQYTDTLQDEEADPAALAAQLLALYDVKGRSLTVENALGDPTVRPGCLLPVTLALGDIDVDRYMLVESVTHHFSCGTHLMDLELR